MGGLGFGVLGGPHCSGPYREHAEKRPCHPGPGGH